MNPGDPKLRLRRLLNLRLFIQFLLRRAKTAKRAKLARSFNEIYQMKSLHLKIAYPEERKRKNIYKELFAAQISKQSHFIIKERSIVQ